MPRFEKGTDNAKSAMIRCRNAKRLKKERIMIDDAVNKIQKEVEEDIQNKILKEEKKDKSNIPNIQLDIESKSPPDDMKCIIYELQQQILDLAKDVDYLLMKE